MGLSTLRRPPRAPRARAGAAVLAAAGLAVGGQIAAGAPARALIQTRPPLAYVVDSGGQTPGDISVIDPATDTVVSTIRAIRNPGGLALAPDGATLYTEDASGVVAVDTASQAIRSVLPVQSSVLALNPTGTELYAGGPNSLTVLDTRTDAVTATIPIPGGVGHIGVNPNGGQLYITQAAPVAQTGQTGQTGNSPIAVVDTATNTVAASIAAVSTASDVAFDATGSHAYVTDVLHHTVSVLDTADTAVLSTIPLSGAPYDVAATPSGAKLYVTDYADRTVSVVDTASGTVTSTIAARMGPEAVTVNGAGTEAYVVNQGDNSVSVIDTNTDTVTNVVPVGYNAQDIAVYNGAVGSCPCSLFPAYSAPDTADSNDPYGVVLGVKVTPSASGRIDGVRFYKSSANTGTHTGSFWSSDGTLLATGTFTGETATGWQTLMFANPVPVRSGVTYVASYYAPNGHYAYDTGYFMNEAAGLPPITAPSNGDGGGNGVYTYDGASAFPTYTWNAVNYWVDVVFDNTGVPRTAPVVTGTTPTSGATGIAATAGLTATFSAPMDKSSMHFTLTDPSGAQVPGVVSYNAAYTTATFTPQTQLPGGTVFTASVQGADGWGTAMSGPVTWTFTSDAAPAPYKCPCTLFGSDAKPAVADATDPNPVELGIRFTPAVKGYVTGIRFYKGPSNTGVHTGTLWNNSTETRIAFGTFTNETTSGWQTMNFATPVPVDAGNTYVASYNAPAGKYSYTPGYFSYSHLEYPLLAPAGSGAGQGNGTYGYGSSPTFPGATNNGTDYGVDVVFSTAP